LFSNLFLAWDLPLKKYDNVFAATIPVIKAQMLATHMVPITSAGFFDPKDALSAIIVAGIN